MASAFGSLVNPSNLRRHHFYVCIALRTLPLFYSLAVTDFRPRWYKYVRLLVTPPLLPPSTPECSHANQASREHKPMPDPVTPGNPARTTRNREEARRDVPEPTRVSNARFSLQSTRIARFKGREIPPCDFTVPFFTNFEMGDVFPVRQSHTESPRENRTAVEENPEDDSMDEFFEMDGGDGPTTVASCAGLTATILPEATATPTCGPSCEPCPPTSNQLDGIPIMERDRPQKQNGIAGKPFFQPRSAFESWSRHRQKKPKVSEASCTSGKALEPGLPLGHCNPESEASSSTPQTIDEQRSPSPPPKDCETRSEASSSTTRTITGQRSPSIANLYRDWQTIIEAPSSPSCTQDEEAQLSLTHNELRRLSDLQAVEQIPGGPSYRPSSPPEKDNEEVMRIFRYRCFGLRTPEKASSTSRSDKDEEQLRYRYRSSGRRIEDNRMISDSALSPKRNSTAGRRPQDNQRSMSCNGRVAPYVLNRVSECWAQPESPSTMPISPPLAINEILRQSPESRNSNPLLRSVFVLENNNEQRNSNTSKPASTAAPLTRGHNEDQSPTISRPASRLASPYLKYEERPNGQTLREGFQATLLEEVLSWNLWLPSDVKKYMFFPPSGLFKPWHPSLMVEEWTRREYYVLSQRMLDPELTPVFGTAEYYELDLLRCFTNMNGHHGYGVVTWPPGYTPRYLEEAAAWDPEDDISVFVEDIAYDDGAESVRSSTDGSD